MGYEKRTIELLLYMICHDIKNINQVSLGYLELLLADKNLDEKQRQYGEKILKAFQSSTKLIQKVEKIMQAGAFKFQLVDLNSILKETIEEFPIPPLKEVEINYQPRENLIVNSSPLLKDVFANLIDNAIKHSGKNRVKIDISIEDYIWRNKQYYKIAFEDDGKGIPDDLKKELLNSTKKPKGLGLYLVRTIVEKTGGEVWIEDRVKGEPEKGARIVVILPKLASS
ncbi:MAG: HAMP domain-containing sensor histidine kinase [Methanocellales archaeon]